MHNLVLFICRGCLNPVTSAGRNCVDIGASAKLQTVESYTVFICQQSHLLLVDKFCYLGDMLSVDGDANAAGEARMRIG